MHDALSMWLRFDSEVELVEKVVAIVLKALPLSPPLPPTRYPVGLKKTSIHVINMLHNMGEGLGVLGICGMGGIGKTTLAKEIFNQEQSNFENMSFLKDVKDAKGIGIMDLQMKMMVDVLGEDSKMIKDYAQGFEMIQRSEVFIVVDDVDTVEQFDELIPNLNQLAPGSRVIITSRERDILNYIMADVPEHQRVLYHVQELSFSDSLELFINHAFQKKNLGDVDITFHDDVKKITKACGGIPLALKVIGRSLASKKDQPRCWTEANLALRKHGDVISRLQISYDNLMNDDDKRMFVDIACFMLGHSKDNALEIWNSIGYDSPSWSLNRLIDKCLVNVDTKGTLCIHDLLRDMGRKIVMDKARGKLELQSHIWDPSTASKILQKKQVRSFCILNNDFKIKNICNPLRLAIINVHVNCFLFISYNEFLQIIVILRIVIEISINMLIKNINTSILSNQSFSKCTGHE